MRDKKQLKQLEEPLIHRNKSLRADDFLLSFHPRDRNPRRSSRRCRLSRLPCPLCPAPRRSLEPVILPCSMTAAKIRSSFNTSSGSSLLPSAIPPVKTDHFTP